MGSCTCCSYPDEDLSRQAEALFWQRWQLASDPDPTIWELATPLDLPFAP